MIMTLFNFEGKEFNLDFSQDSLNGLYIVYDKISKCPVSRVIEAKNDLIAIKGFEKVVEDAKNKNDLSILQLVNLGDINYELKTIFASEEKDRLICDSRFDFKKFYEESFAWLNAQEE